MPPPGDLAVISQSGAIAAGLIEWSVAHGIGFSAAVSLGDRIDVDFGDLLDFFALDRGTRARGDRPARRVLFRDRSDGSGRFRGSDPSLHRVAQRRAQVHLRRGEQLVQIHHPQQAARVRGTPGGA
jgi:Succinyl-CoA ligase like flavodoxin domain